MASPLARLKRRSEFLRVAKTHQKWVASGLVLQVRRYGRSERAATGGAVLRVGFTVSKKVGNAVERNRVRRRLRVAAQTVIGVHGAPGRDFVVIGRKNALKRSFAALLKDMETALKKLDAWCENQDASSSRPDIRDAENKNSNEPSQKIHVKGEGHGGKERDAV
ncbi:ribonuclease P protein component [Varunaivibrio sulfuroxidans]|uniref:Ribonuclease P protein component n=1 Tax=Varunaivibrio sulfuroxidans TaxID=1773489 RepID=A0A4R3JHL4_9PROT|nr:ribonuclease P protein component [Varunaivibrio sulfuroxidans]TCS65005.1 ribonuclease P protein component [Varunaivibrio sulfuroxidans]WES29704.1 ribonuclease P protein component [Varunaivibrio sulfuroxidans]